MVLARFPRLIYLFIHSQTGSHYVAQVALNSQSSCLRLPSSWDYSHVPLQVPIKPVRNSTDNMLRESLGTMLGDPLGWEVGGLMEYYPEETSSTVKTRVLPVIAHTATSNSSDTTPIPLPHTISKTNSCSSTFLMSVNHDSNHTYFFSINMFFKHLLMSDINNGKISGISGLA